MVDGKILMEHRKVKTVDEVEVMEKAQAEAEKMVEKAGVQPFMQIHDNFWGHSRY
jgi:Xaa-Pro aminopeptidase